jgi:O-antigen ligase
VGSLFTITAVFGTLLLVYFSLVKPSEFIYYLFLIKPFIDLTVGIEFFGISTLEFLAVYLLLYCSFYLLFRKNVSNLFNFKIYLVFIALNIFSLLYRVFIKPPLAIASVDIVIKIVEAFLLYLLASFYSADFKNRFKVYKIIWFTLLILNLFFIMQTVLGQSRFIYGAEYGYHRYTGVYMDTGTPAYQAVFSLFFSSLVLKCYKENKTRISLMLKYVYFLTWVSVLITLGITLTMSAMLMLIIFILLIYSRRRIFSLLIISLALSSAIFVLFRNSEVLQSRFQKEIRYIEDPNDKTLGSVGQGRVSRWERIWYYYESKFTIYEKLFGNSETYGAHNNYLAVLTSVGLIGLITFFLIWIRFMSRLLFLYKRLKLAEFYYAFTLLVIFMVYALTGHPFYYTTLLWYLMIMLSLVNLTKLSMVNCRKTSSPDTKISR